jgi:hypothetical protein
MTIAVRTSQQSRSVQSVLSFTFVLMRGRGRPHVLPSSLRGGLNLDSLRCGEGEDEGEAGGERE